MAKDKQGSAAEAAKSDPTKLGGAAAVPLEVRKAAVLAELAEIEAAEKQAAKIEYPKALYKNGNVHEVVTVENADEEAARVAEGYGDLGPVKG